jgi:protein tyrosine phosphatase (PTP) superfamily phosphohydrolase (DUF442 family)
MAELNFKNRLPRSAVAALNMACLLCLLPTVGATENPAVASTNSSARALSIPGVHNAYQVSKRIFSGSQPDGEASFAALAKLGVKIIVSVDGSRPDVESARKHGLRYVHLPFGYDGVPTNRVAEFAVLSLRGDGPFYVHCHHGLHRGPAAVAVMCEASERWTTNRAVEWLQLAGTSLDYPGLFRATAEFKMPSATDLAAITAFPEITRPSSLVQTMVAMDEQFTWLKQTQQAAWKSPPGHADISPAHTATILWEQFRELARFSDTSERPEEFRSHLREGEAIADALRKTLRDSANPAAVDAVFKRLGQNCASCHKQFRNE